MADKSKAGDQTEKATPKRLRDARKKGEVAKSKDLTSTLVLGAWLILGSLVWRFIFTSLREPFTGALAAVTDPSIYAMKAVGVASLSAFAKVSLALLIPIAILGMLAEFAQVGPVLTFEKMSPKLEHMNPAEGLKRMFSVDNLVEVGKSLAKAVFLVILLFVVLSLQFPRLADLPMGGSGGALAAMGSAMFQLVAATLVTFFLVSGADISYQRFAFAKKMRMSRREIKQESKDSEGDPMLKGRRRQLHQEWASRNVVEAARGATALVMNPTHIAVALAYDPQEHPAPVVTAKGMGPLAMEMRRAAEGEGVPVIQNVAVARALNARAPLDDIVPSDMFAAVAEVIVFARKLREEMEAKTHAASPDAAGEAPRGDGVILDGLRELLSIVVALAAVSLLAWGAIWVMKRLQTRAASAPGAADDLRFIRALPLGPRERLVVVEWRGETLLLGVTAGGITPLKGGMGASLIDPQKPVDIQQTSER